MDQSSTKISIPRRRNLPHPWPAGAKVILKAARHGIFGVKGKIKEAIPGKKRFYYSVRLETGEDVCLDDDELFLI